MRKVVRAVIIENDSLIVIKRIKNGQTYWVFPGGGVDYGEDSEIALVRECKEELGLEVEVLDLLSEHFFVSDSLGEQKEFFYRCRVIGGILGTGDGDEYNGGLEHVGIYEPVRISLERLSEFDLRPAQIKSMVENSK